MAGFKGSSYINILTYIVFTIVPVIMFATIMSKILVYVLAFSKYSAAIYFFGQEFWLEFFCWQLLTFDLLKLATPRIRFTTRVEFWSEIYSYFDQTKIDDHRFFQECQQNFRKKWWSSVFPGIKWAKKLT